MVCAFPVSSRPELEPSGFKADLGALVGWLGQGWVVAQPNEQHNLARSPVARIGGVGWMLSCQDRGVGGGGIVRGLSSSLSWWVGGWAQMRSTPSHYTLNVDFWLDPTFVQGCIQSGSADC